MTIMVATTQRSTIKLDKGATVLDLIQALTENLGGEWDDAVLELGGQYGDGGFSIVAVLQDDEEPARAPRWESEDGKHIATRNPDNGLRTCSCRSFGTANLTDEQMTKHMNEAVGFNWTGEA